MKCWKAHCLAKADVLLSMPMLIGESSTFVPRCANHFEADYKGALPPMLFFFKDQVTAYLVAERLSDGP